MLRWQDVFDLGKSVQPFQPEIEGLMARFDTPNGQVVLQNIVDRTGGARIPIEIDNGTSAHARYWRGNIYLTPDDFLTVEQKLREDGGIESSRGVAPTFERTFIHELSHAVTPNLHYFREAGVREYVLEVMRLRSEGKLSAQDLAYVLEPLSQVADNETADEMLAAAYGQLLFGAQYGGPRWYYSNELSDGSSVVFGDLDYGTPVLPYDQMPDAMALINPANMYAGTIDYGPIAELLSESLARLQEKGISEEGLALRYALPRSDSANGLPSLTGDFNQSAAHEFDVYSSKMGIIYEVSGSTRLRDPNTGAILPVGSSVVRLASRPSPSASASTYWSPWRPQKRGTLN